MKTPTKSSRSDRNRLMLSGLKKHYAATPSITVGGVQHGTTDIESTLQGSIDAAASTAAASAVFHKAVAAEQAANATGDALYRGLRAILINQYKTAPDTLADFGITLPQRQVPDAATVADAVVKGQATRAARHTLGTRQKAKIKGTVANPVTPGNAPVPATTPATAQPVKQA
jgi:hypothetical protein